MKNLKLTERRGFAQIFLLVGMLMIAVALPLATKLVQQNQENRSSAAAPSCSVKSDAGHTKCSDGAMRTCKGVTAAGKTYYVWSKTKECDHGCNTAGTACYTSSSPSSATNVSCTYKGTKIASGKQKCIGGVLVTCKTTGKYSTKTCNNGCTSSGGSCAINSVCIYGSGEYGNGSINCRTDGKLYKCSVSDKGKGSWSEFDSCDGKGCSGSKCNGASSTIKPADCNYSNLYSTKCTSDNKKVQMCKGKQEGYVGVSYSYEDYSPCTSGCEQVDAKKARCKESTYMSKENWATCRSDSECKSGKCGNVTKTCSDRVVKERKCEQLSAGFVDYSETGYDVKGNRIVSNWCVFGCSNGACSLTSVNTDSRCVGVAYNKAVCSGTSLITCDDKGRLVTESRNDSACANGDGSSFGYYWNGSSCIKSALYCGSSSWPTAYGTCYSSEDNCKTAHASTTSFGYYWNGSSCVKSALSCGSSSWPSSYGTCYSSEDNCRATISLLGSPKTNSSACKNKNGICATYTKKLSDGAPCRVSGYTGVGTIKTGYCSGDSYTVCCTGITGSTSSGGSTSGGSSTNNNGGSSSGGGNDTTVAVTGITLSPPSLNLKVGQSQAITATVAPTNATDTTVTWSSDKTAVAEVGSATGLVVGKGLGTAIITAKTSNGKTATASATVVAATTPVTPVTTNPRISFKFSLRGVKPAASSCFDKLGDLKIDVVNSPTNAYQTGLSTDFSVVAGETNVNGDQVFKVTALSLDSTKFASVNTFNYLKVKGPFHLKRRMCLDNQSTKLSETTICNINLASDTVYDFSDYTLLAGDLNIDGIINSIDYSYVKTRLDAGADVSCGREGDLNLDGVVNAGDANLIKEALSSKDDE